MSHLNNNILDDPLLSDGMETFAGQASTPKASRIGPDECAELVNFDVTTNGSVRTRNGTRAAGALPGTGRVQGLAFYHTPSLQCLLAARAGKLYEGDGLDDTTWTQKSAALADAPVSSAQLVDLMFFADGAALWQWDGTDLTEVAAAPASKYVIAHTSRLFAACHPTQPDGLAVSDILDGATWPTPTHRLRVGAGDGEGIANILSWQRDVIAVLKERSVWVVNADPLLEPGQWPIDRVPGEVGCVAPRSAVRAGDDIFFLAADGVHSLSRSIQQDDLQVSLPLSTPVQDIIERINWAAVGTACAAFYNNRYLLAVPLGNASEPDAVLVYNTVQQRWSGTWTGWSPSCFGRANFGVDRMLFGESTGAVKAFRDGDALVYDDDGAPVAAKLLSRAFHFGAVQNPKSPFSVEIDFRNSRDGVTVTLVPDGGRTTELETGLSTAKEGLPLPIPGLPFSLLAPGSLLRSWGAQHVGQLREMQILIEGEGADVLQVRGIHANAFLDTLEGDR